MSVGNLEGHERFCGSGVVSGGVQVVWGNVVTRGC